MINFFGKVVFGVVGLFGILCILIVVGDIIDNIILKIKKKKECFKRIW